jgi:hypothetical protein
MDLSTIISLAGCALCIISFVLLRWRLASRFASRDVMALR